MVPVSASTYLSWFVNRSKPMRTIDRLLEEYGESHQNPTNMFSLLGWLR